MRPIFLGMFGLGLGVVIASWGACTPEAASPEPEPGASCQSGQTRACSCAAGRSQTCTAGQWSACDCSGVQVGPGTPISDASVAASDAGAPTGTAEPALPCEVQTLLRKECGACHGRNNEYPAPMKLETYADLHAAAPSDPASKVYAKLLERVQDPTRPMPPPQFSERLSVTEVATLKSWVDRGAPPATAVDRCTPQDQPADAGTPDGGKPSVDMAGAPDDCEEYFELRAHAEGDPNAPFQVPSRQGQEANTYHCFYFGADYASEAQGLWFKSLADNKRVLHHWLLYASELDAVHAPGSQAPCSAAEPGAYLIAGWAPGAPDYKPPPDVGLDMPHGPNVRLILELHWYNDTGSPQADRSGVRFCTAKKGKRPHTAGVHFTGSEGICIEPQSRHEVTGLCDPDDTQDIHILRVWPHMHQLARNMRVTILRADGSRQVLHDQPFDFNDQRAYDMNDVVLRPGDRLETVCSYDNRTNMRVPFGEDTQEEMCFAFITAWPAGSLVNGVLDVASWIGGPLQPARRCLDPLAILNSCNGLADYPPPGG